MTEKPFDEYAEDYDAWFMKNRNILSSEKRLLKRFLADPGRTLSVGCGSGLFEQLLRIEDGIVIEHGVEPMEPMAAIARQRGISVEIAPAEALPFGDGAFDTVVFNGTPSYIADLPRAFAEAYRVLKSGGRIVVADVPAESSYGLLYRLAAITGSWDDAHLQKAKPRDPYPLEFAAAANWRSTEEKATMLRDAGFVDLQFAQTLTVHPRYSDDSVEEPTEGYERGDYVAITARKS